MAYKYVLFDLDGTITNPYEGISKCVKYALEYFNITENDEKILKSFIGPPLKESFSRIYGFSELQAEEAVKKYRERYFEKGVYENVLIDGVRETLAELKNSGRKIFLATSKPQILAKMILQDFELTEYFDFIGGADLTFGRDEKWQVIDYVFESCNISDRNSAVIVGDRKHDIIGAKKTGIKSIAVLCGFGDREEFNEYGADYICEKLYDIIEIIKK